VQTSVQEVNKNETPFRTQNNSKVTFEQKSEEEKAPSEKELTEKDEVEEGACQVGDSLKNMPAFKETNEGQVQTEQVQFFDPDTKITPELPSEHSDKESDVRDWEDSQLYKFVLSRHQVSRAATAINTTKPRDREDLTKCKTELTVGKSIANNKNATSSSKNQLKEPPNMKEGSSYVSQKHEERKSISKQSLNVKSNLEIES